MSKVAIQGDPSGTGTFTIASPNSNNNRTLTLPDATGTIITTAGGAAISGTTGSFSGDLSFNSGYGSAAVAYGCRAWVNFNGTTNVGGFCTVRASGNVSTVADNGTGDYTINFTTAMPDANYAVNTSTNITSGGSNSGFSNFYNTTTTSLRLTATTSAGSFADAFQFSVSVFR